MRAFLEASYTRLVTRPVFLAWISASLVTALSGPFGSYGWFDFPERLLYWSVAILLAIVVGVLAQEAVRAVRPVLHGWTETLFVSAALCFLFTPVLVGVTWRVAGQDHDQTATLLAIAAAVFLVPVSLTALSHFWVGEEVLDGPRLLRRLGNGAHQVRRVAVRDHYVDVFTDAGKETLLMRFSDALEELEGAQGLRVHRSHWVSRDVIVGIEEEGTRMFLRLECGSRIPVSRGYRKEVERAGLPR